MITPGQVALKNSFAERNFSNWYDNSYQVSDFRKAYVHNVSPPKYCIHFINFQESFSGACQKPTIILSKLEQDLPEWELKLTNVSSLNDAIQLVWIIKFY